MQLSTFGEKFSGFTGITELMDDLGSAMSGHKKMYMLGGGNPARITEVETVWRERMHAILDDTDSFETMLAHYDRPHGRSVFIDALVECFNSIYGWNIGPEHIAITNGSQNAFFYLLNMLAGEHASGAFKKILFPLMPEYIGYADQGLFPEMFHSEIPLITEIGDHFFKYHVDFDHLTIDDSVAALCVSRPTNPTGNVLTNDEVHHLDRLAREHDIPLIIDNAYGAPFPDIIFKDIQPTWNSNTILTLSLSKLGLPGTRTGIVIADPSITEKLAYINAVVGLANTNIGQEIAAPLLLNGELLRLSRDVIRPYYEQRSKQAIEWILESFGSKVEYRIHLSEGSIFLWIWFKNLPVSTAVLYERLKARNVLVVPGHYFFYGIDQDWSHRNECIRMTYSQPEDMVKEGIRIMAEVLDDLCTA